jgi:glucose/arabinose dehydrogenase/subtilisin family serine protease
MGRTRAAVVVALVILSTIASFPAAAREDVGPRAIAQSGTTDERMSPPPPPRKNARLTSDLLAVAETAARQGVAAGLSVARERLLDVSADRLRVVVESSLSAAAAAAIRGAGGAVVGTYAHLTEALVPVDGLLGLAMNTAVTLVRSPLRPVPLAVAGQGVGTTNASAWQTAGLSGSGVKVAVIDGGFAGLAARQTAGDLPLSITTADFCAGGFNTATDHGTAVAEIVHEMAPGAQLMLLCVTTEVSLGQAKDFAVAQGATIINMSLGYPNSSRGDGTGGAGSPDAIVASARSAGILWVNSAGNQAQRHWSGTFFDPDADGFHNFATADAGNTVLIPAGAQICVWLKWDQWPSSNQDFDLYIVRSADSVIVEASENPQTGTQPPTEARCYLNTTGVTQNFFIAIRKFSATAAPQFDLFISPGTLEYQTAAGSILEPASSSSALAVGAICWSTDGLESFSSLGPTIDGRVKPDIAGPDSVSSGTSGTFTSCGSSGFVGTSAASPHVAGAAALAKQANPSFTTEQLQTFLQGRAVDLGTAGKDNLYGAGKLWLGGCASASFSPAPASPQTAGVTVNWTAGASGCSTPQFQIWMRPPSGSWQMSRDWSTSTALAWDSTGAAAGGYTFELLARQSGSGAAYEAFVDVPYTLNAAGPQPPILNATVIQSGLVIPWDLDFAPDGRLFVSERVAGSIKIFASTATDAALLGTTVVPVRTGNESGLMSITLDPNFSTNHFVYVCASQNDVSDEWRNNVLRYVEGPTNTLTFDGYVLKRKMWANQNHNGCRLRFGPDGKLWITMGDAETSSDAQSVTSLNGKVLRVNSDGSVPSDNPTLPGAAAPTEAYTMGHRNPQGLAFQPGTGTPFEVEHGPDTDDEVNALVAGANYGWPTVTGNDGVGGFQDPAWESNSPTLAISGSTFVTGTNWGTWTGDLLVATLKEQDLRHFAVSGATMTPAADRYVNFNTTYGRLRTPRVGLDGALYLTSSNGSNDTIVRVVAAQPGGGRLRSPVVSGEPQTAKRTRRAPRRRPASAGSTRAFSADTT